MNHIKLAFAAVAACLPMAAHADITWYGGFGAGGARLEQDLNLTYSAFEYNGDDVLVPVVNAVQGSPDLGKVSSARLDKFNGTDLGYRVFGGVMFLPWLGLEAGYVSLGASEDEIELNIPGTSGPNPLDPICNACRPNTDVLLSLEDEIDGWDAYVVGALPINDVVTLFAKVGAINWNSDFSAKNGFRETFPPSGPDSQQPVIPTTEPESFKTDEDGTDLAGGLGVDLTIVEGIKVRLEGTWYDIEKTEQAWLLGVNLMLTY